MDDSSRDTEVRRAGSRIAAVGLMAGSMLGLGCLAFDCESEELQRVASPGGKFEALVSRKDCGALDSGATIRVEIVDPGGEVNSGETVASITGSRQCARGKPNVEVGWDPEALELIVSYHSDSNASLVTRYKNVSIKYRHCDVDPVDSIGTDPPMLTSGHAPVNGISMYYEVHGKHGGLPLVLLHGGGSTIDVTFGKVLPFLAAHRRVIAVEEQGHGRTTDRDAPVRFETSAGDVAALLRYLEIEQADVFGFSNGASVALQVAIRHPELLHKLVFASAMTKRSGARPEFWQFMEQADFSNMPQPLKDAFLRVTPDEGRLRTMHDKDAERMRSFQDVPDDLVHSVRAPTLIVLGDRDLVTPEHVLELTRLIEGSRLLILPGGHGDWLGELVMAPADNRYPELTAALVEEFLDSPVEDGRGP